MSPDRVEGTMSQPLAWAPKMERGGDVCVITLTGTSRAGFENLIARELDGRLDALGGCHLLLDFNNIECLNSAELGTLISLHKRMKNSGGRLTLFDFKASVYEIIIVTHLQTLLNVCR
jgi:anti-anti-sigma factor